MTNSELNRFGIVIRGKISDWTKDIVNEYKTNFPNAQIVVSTWSNENTDDINCDIIKTEEIRMPSPHRSSINHQVTLAKKGLEKISSDIIMVCRADQFIHNKNILEIYKNKCPKTKLLVSTFPAFLHGTPRDYRYTYSMNDMCQIGVNKLLHDFWDHVPIFDGSKSISVARTIIRNYVVNVKNDKREWSIVKNDYFYERDYYRDFKIENSRPILFKNYRMKLNETLKKYAK